MAVALASLTLEQFLALPDQQPTLEYIDGAVKEKVSPKARHSALQSALVLSLSKAAEPNDVAWVFPELRVTFAGESRVPDISVFLSSRVTWEADDTLADDIFAAPDVAIEITSPGQGPGAMVRRGLWYVQNGVRVALVVDPGDESVVAFRPSGQVVPLRGEDRIDLHEILPAFDLSVSELFASIRKRRPAD